MSAASSTSERLVLVAVPVPSLDLLTYGVPDGTSMPRIGARVVVQLGTRVVTGIVVEANVRPSIEEQGPTSKLKPIREVLDAFAFVPPDVVALARWTAEYYAAGVGDTIPALLPPMARGGRADAHKTTRMAAITAAGLEALSVGADPSAGPGGHASPSLRGKQQEALELLAGTPTGLGTSMLAARGIAADAISRLARRGYISLRHDRVDRDPFAEPEKEPEKGLTPGLTPIGRQLTGEQGDALARLRALA